MVFVLDTSRLRELTEPLARRGAASVPARPRPRSALGDVRRERSSGRRSLAAHQAEPEARRVAVQQIAKVHGREAPELLLRALGDDDWRVRKEATLVAPALERREEVVAALVAALEETVNIGLRNAAVEALVAIGPDAVGATIDALWRARRRRAQARGRGARRACPTRAAPRRSCRRARGRRRERPRRGRRGARQRGARGRGGARAWPRGRSSSALATSDTFLKIAALDSLARLEARLPWSVFEPYADDPLLRRYAIAAAAGSREPRRRPRARAGRRATRSPTIAREAIVASGDLVAAGADDEALARARARRARDSAPGTRTRGARRATPRTRRARGGALLVLGLLGRCRTSRSWSTRWATTTWPSAPTSRCASSGRTPSGRCSRPRAARGPPSARRRSRWWRRSRGRTSARCARRSRRRARRTHPSRSLSCAVEALGALGDRRGPVACRRTRLAPRTSASPPAATNAVSELAARHVDAARALLREPASGHDPLVLGCILLGAIASTQSLTPRGRAAPRARARPRRPAGAPRGDRRARASRRGRSGRRRGLRAGRRGARREARGGARARAASARRAARARRRRHARSGRSPRPRFARSATRTPSAPSAAARPLVRHADAAVACAAVEAIGQLLRRPGAPPCTAPAREDALFAALDHPDAEVVKLALSLVGVAARRPRARPPRHCASTTPRGRCAASPPSCSARTRAAGARALLRARYEREKDPIVRAAIAAAVSVRPRCGDASLAVRGVAGRKEAPGKGSSAPSGTARATRSCSSRTSSGCCATCSPREPACSFGPEARFALERRLRERSSSSSSRASPSTTTTCASARTPTPSGTRPIDLLTTNETYFFREERQLRAFQNELLPMLQTQARAPPAARRSGARAARRARRPTRSRSSSTNRASFPARAWSGKLDADAAVSAGRSRSRPRWDVRIYGSDISRRCVAAARRGVYGESSFRATPDDVAAAFFQERPDGWHVPNRSVSSAISGR